MSSPRHDDPTATEINRAVWERAMRQLNVCSRLLAAVLLALGARLVISGPTPLTLLSAAIVALLLLASLLLIRHGRRHQPRFRPSTPTARRPAQDNHGPGRVSRR